MMKRKILTVLMLVLLGIIGISCVKIAGILLRSKTENDDFQRLASLTVMPSESNPGAAAASEREPVQAAEPDETREDDWFDVETEEEEFFFDDPVPPADGEVPVHTRNLSPLFERNPDCIGWLFIADTKIDYPVMHTPDEPEKYLHRNFDCEDSSSGVPFLQGNETLDSDNLIIYGHNMKNGTMFRDLLQYRNKSFCLGHPTIELETAQGLQCYSVFAVAQVPPTDGWYQFADAFDAADYSDQITELLQRALVTVGTPPQHGQQLLTLSTCIGVNNAERLLVIAAAQ